MQNSSDGTYDFLLRIGLSLIIILIIFEISSGFDRNQNGQPVEGQRMKEILAPPLQYDPKYRPSRVPPPEATTLGIQSATFYINNGAASCGGGSMPPSELNAFSYAVSIWGSLIDSDQIITIDVCWVALSGNILGIGGPTLAFVSGNWYPMALANELLNTDLNGSTREMRLRLNSSPVAPWYLGTDGNTPAGYIDLATVALHEIGHGLGFVGSMEVSGGMGSWGDSGIPYRFDNFAEDGSGFPLLNYPNPSASLANALTGKVGGGVYFDGPNANLANANLRSKLYTPSTWQNGSSYSHLDDATFDFTVNALMTHALNNGASIHSPGPVTLGIFEDMGWQVNNLDQPDLKISKRVTGTGHKPGDPVAFELSIQNIGTVTATQVLVTDTLSSDILSPGWDRSSSLAGTSVQSGTYVWSLPDLPPDFSGLITVTGTIRDTLPEDFAILNSATIGTVDTELSTNNNSSAAMIGGKRSYLPVVVKNN